MARLVAAMVTKKEVSTLAWGLHVKYVSMADGGRSGKPWVIGERELTKPVRSKNGPSKPPHAAGKRVLKDLQLAAAKRGDKVECPQLAWFTELR